jgi:hypothetical protein
MSQRGRIRLGHLTSRVGPWSLSLVLHLALIGLGFGLTWSIIRHEAHLPSPVVASNVVMVTPPMPLQGESEVSRQAPQLDVPAMDAIDPSPPVVAGPAPAPLNLQPPATFAGASMRAASDVVFVIDSSGSMMAWVFSIIDEVERSLQAMTGDQRFAVICFAGEAVWQVPRRGLRPVTPTSINEAVTALRGGINRLSGFGSDPVAAIEAAIELRPELIMLLSEGIDGRGRFSVDRAAALKSLDSLNPTGIGEARPVAISCIQLLVGTPSPATLMRDIAAAHGGTFNTIASEDLDP